MALKALLLKKSITDTRAALEAEEARSAEFANREIEIERSIDETVTNEERDAVNAVIDTFEQEKANHEAAIVSLREKISALEAELATIEVAQDTTEPEAEKIEREDKTPMENREEIIRNERAAFVDYVKTGRMERADYNMQKTNNGAVVPKSIAQEIVNKVTNIAPLYAMATKYNVKGQLDIPCYPASSSHVVAAAYGTEFTDLEAASGDFTSVSLTGYVAGALAKISKSLINNADVDVTSFIVDEVATAFAKFIEKEAIVGTNNKIVGLSGSTNTISASKMSSVTADELINLQCAIPDAFQAGSCWLMHPATRKAIRKLKDGQGNYLLVPDFSAGGTAYTLLGKPVYVSDNCPQMGTASNKAIYYGDFSGLAMKFSEDLDIEILRERYAPQHAVGVVGWTEVDCKIANQQKIACMVMGANDN